MSDQCAGVLPELPAVELDPVGAAVVMGIPDGTSSTHVTPGARGIVAPERSTSAMGDDSDERRQVPAMATPLRRTTTGPLPVASTSTSWAPRLFSTHGPVNVWTCMATTLATAIGAEAPSIIGPLNVVAGWPAYESCQSLLPGTHVQVTSLVEENGMWTDEVVVPPSGTAAR